MTTSFSKDVRRLILSIAVVVAASGCVSVIPEPNAPDILIQIPAQPSSGALLSSDVSIFAPEASRALSGVEIAVTDVDGIQYLQKVKWADSSPRLLQDALIDALSAGEGVGHAFSAQSATRADYEVRWRLTELSTAPDAGPARAAARISVLDARTRRVIDDAFVQSRVTPASRRGKDRAQALAEAAREMTEDAARFIAATAVAREQGAS